MPALLVAAWPSEYSLLDWRGNLYLRRMRASKKDKTVVRAGEEGSRYGQER
jgi:hypothetical protein